MARSNLENVDSYQALIEGLNANFTAKTSLALVNQTLAVGDIVKQLQARVEARSATTKAQTGYRAAVQAERESDAGVQPLRKAIQRTLEGRYGSDSAKLKEFGFAPAKPRKVAAATVAKAVEQAQATRKARGTMGKVQKKGIKGVVASAPEASTPAAAVQTAATPAAGPAQVVSPAVPPVVSTSNGSPSTNGH